jgi:hypothetical protein
VKLKGDDGQPVRVTLDGVEIPNAVIGVSRPVDPGPHELMAVAADRTSLPVKLTLTEGARETVVLELVPHATSSTPFEEPAGAQSAPATSIYRREPERDSGGSGFRIAGYTALGVGIAGLATGTVFALRSHSKRSEADDLCGGDTCPVSRRDEIDALYDDARTAKSISTAGFIVGGAGVAAGAIFMVLGGQRDESARASGAAGRAKRTRVSRAGIEPVLGLSHVGVSGRF